MKIALTVSYPSSAEASQEDQDRLERYLAAIEAGGAAPTTLFLDEWENRVSQVVEEFDGLILSGGADLPTDWYGETPLPGANLDLVSARRPLFEKQVLAGFEQLQKPVLGICYGCQFLNVHRGGTLLQDIALQVENPIVHGDGALHSVEVARDSRLLEIVGDERFDVPSYHHQSVGKVAPDARVVSWAPDGVIEAVEWPEEAFFLGVQWHPERAPDSPATKRLFAALVAACRA